MGFAEITNQQLLRLIGTPEAPAIIDVRLDDDFAGDPRLIPAAKRRSHLDCAVWGQQYAGRKVVVTCQKGQKLGHGTAASLRQQGIDAESLEGGFDGWRTAGLPLLNLAVLPKADDQGLTRWVTRARPKIDRIACPWLIRRFVDPHASFLFVPPDEVAGVAKFFDATPFDVDGVFWSHRGEMCTFDTLIAELGLDLPALHLLATIVRGADTARLDLAPQASGLLAVSLGLSRMFKNDLAQLDAGMLIYDALYRWCRDGTGETHNWPNPA